MILPDEIREIVEQNSFIAGGAIFSLYHKEEPKDYDFFFTDSAVAELVRETFKYNSTLKYVKGVRIGKYMGFKLVVTDNAITIGKYQLILNWAGTPEDVVNKFDFKHNMYYLKDSAIVNCVDWKFIKEKRLYFNENRARDVANCIVRINKFIKRDFEIDNIEICNILLRLNEVGFSKTDLDILKMKNNARNNFGSGD